VKKTLICLALAALPFTAAHAANAASTGSGTVPVSLDGLKQQLIDAAAKDGSLLQTDEMVTLAGNGLTFAGGSIVGFEQVPSTALAGGVDFGYTYLDAPQSGIPTGIFRLRAHANAQDIKIGDYPGTVDYIDSTGMVVATVAATVESSSLTVPNPLPFPHTTVGASYRMVNRGHWVTTVYIWICPNGEIIWWSTQSWVP
jgi:hypothetical protein